MPPWSPPFPASPPLPGAAPRHSAPKRPSGHVELLTSPSGNVFSDAHPFRNAKPATSHACCQIVSGTSWGPEQLAARTAVTGPTIYWKNLAQTWKKANKFCSYSHRLCKCTHESLPTASSPPLMPLPNFSNCTTRPAALTSQGQNVTPPPSPSPPFLCRIQNSQFTILNPRIPQDSTVPISPHSRLPPDSFPDPRFLPAFPHKPSTARTVPPIFAISYPHSWIFNHL
jgi:hypothetical protein